MDEPMDEACDAVSTQPDIETEHTRKLQVMPLLHPGSMVSMMITMEDYETQYWPKLKKAITQLLTMSPGQHIPISYEQMYSYVYKCVCKHFSQRLYQDILTHMTGHLSCISNELQSLMQTPSLFIEQFSFIINQYIQALSGIVPIFSYMNKFYIETRLKTDLNEELRKLFWATIVDTRAAFLFSLLEETIAKPFTVSPLTVSSLVHNLHSLNPKYAKMNPQLFAKYIPNILPPTRVSDLDRYIEETKLMQWQIQNLPGFEVCDSSASRKRPIDENVK